MTSKTQKNFAFDPAQQLDLLIQKCSSLRISLYKLNALYLELLRSILPGAVKESVVQIILLGKSGAISKLNDNSKESFQERISEAISECLSLLTVENLLAYSFSLDDEKKITKEYDNSNISIDQLFGTNGKIAVEDFNDDYHSVELINTLPIDNKIDLKDWNLEDQDLTSYNVEFDEEIDVETNEITLEEPVNDESNQNLGKKDLDLLQSIFKMAGNLIAPKETLIKANLEDGVSDNKEDSSSKTLTQEYSFPQTPEELSKWSLSIETALVRRLRNLSHLINVELMQMGILNTFVPTNLLDSVIAGQIASANAPSNIIRLRLPLSATYNNEIDVLCILIRTSELEFDHLRLRQCRNQLTQQRNSLLKMIRQQHYWQSRLLANEVREKWWKTTPTKPTHNLESS